MHTKTIPAKLIGFFTRSPYTHVGLCLDKDCSLIYSFGRRNLHCFFIGGFTTEKKNGAFFTKFKQTDCKIFELAITDKKYQKLTKRLNKMQKNAKTYKYDFLGIIPHLLGIPLSFKNKYVCSSFVATILMDLNICKFTKKPCLIKPQDFNLFNFKTIYEGQYALYQ